MKPLMPTQSHKDLFIEDARNCCDQTLQTQKKESNFQIC
ncbi:hypothetical protein FEM08_27940 [Flavobacterium gilvum]|nr:hypothetical protein FEM08_27940 [Flavobacterium gilvum]